MPISRRRILQAGAGSVLAMMIPGKTFGQDSTKTSEDVMEKKESENAPPLYPKFDTHMHAEGPKEDLLPVLDALGVRRVLNLSYSGFREPAELLAFENKLLADMDKYPNRFRFAPAFNVTRFREPGYTDSVIAKLANDIDRHGAVAVKIWKDLGMMLRDDDGRYVFCDDTRFLPIYDYIVSRGLVIYSHIADPLAGWLPLDTPSPHARYFRNHPEFHWYGKPDKPSHDEILRHRDALVARYPKTIFVAAHLASMEHDLEETAKFLDTFPNVRIDTAARFADLMMKPDAQVRAFFIKYQDRILYGTDCDFNAEELGKTPEAKRQKIKSIITAHQKNFTYFEDTLALPPDVLRKFYYENAAALFAKSKK
ncbi:MAG TPA: amidohydrolase family protein [Candidatus Hydrogenedentes bacterium]|nr:amidohydrolase family protein [Candidatus Hydrogenedentota bacterium]